MTRTVKVQGSAVVLPEYQRDPPASDELIESEIAVRAYSYWEARGFHGGSPNDDWHRAVKELEEELQK